MEQKANQPKTPSILRSSQVRRRQSSTAQKIINNNQININHQNKRTSLINKFQPRSLVQNGQKYHFNYQQKQKALDIQQQNNKRQSIVVCNSLPKGSKPKYSFTYNNPLSMPPPTQSLKTQTFISHNQSIHLSKPIQKPLSSRIQSNKQFFPYNVKVRKDLDLCLYNLTDKLRQIKKQQETQQGNKKEPRPTIVQLRANRFSSDNTIHRIQPQLVEQYIQTVYREYSIPDPLDNTQKLDNQQQNQQLISKLYVNKQIDTNQYFNHKSIGQLRKNNHLIQKQKRKNLKNGHKQYLNLTLSKQKHVTQKRFNSPVRKLQKQKLPSQRTPQSKSQSRSLSKKSHSQKRILKIKQNISNWKDSEHLYVERFSYLKSPYQILKQNTIHKTENQQVNVKVRPFDELMKVNTETIDSQFYGRPTTNSTYQTNKNITTKSNFFDSKYKTTKSNLFITRDGQILQEFRYCILCQNPIISANIQKHEIKCTGWIFKNKLFVFKNVYDIQSQDELIQLIKGRIQQIHVRMNQKINTIRQKQTQLQQSSDTKYADYVNTNIIQSIKNYLQSTSLENLQNWQAKTQLMNSDFRNVQQNYKNQYWLLMQDANKLHWFVNLLRNYQLSLKLSGVSKGIKGLSSTKQRNNNSLIQSSHQIISQFPIK